MDPTNKQIEEFLSSYITSALWAETDNAKKCPRCRGRKKVLLDKCPKCKGSGRVPDENSNGGDPFDDHFDREFIHEDTIKQMREDCTQFLREHGVPDYSLADRVSGNFTDLDRAAHDFWLTRNGHGVGFWDRGFPKEISDKYTKAAKTFGDYGLYLGDDGMIHGG